MTGHAGTSQATLAGARLLTGLILRRDRFLLPLWTVVLAGFVPATAAGLARSYPTQAAREAFAADIWGNPAMTAIYGPLASDSLGALVAWRVAVAGGLLFGLFGIVTVVRHTRREEETGRWELLRSGSIGRHAPLSAIVLVVVGEYLLVGVLMVASAVKIGLPAAGSAALAAGLVGIGLVTAAVAAVAVQLARSSRTAIGISAAALGVLLMVRMAGNTGPGAAWLLLLTPFGWAQLVRPFAHEWWAVLLTPAAVTPALLALAYRLSARRDLGAGLLPEREGPPVASPSLRGPMSLAWRLHRGTLTAVVAGFAVIGALIGGVATSVAGALGSSPMFEQMMNRLHAATAGDATISLLIYALAEMSCLYGVAAALRPRGEEFEGHAALLLVAGASRRRFLGGHLLVAVLGPAVVLVALGVAAGLTYGIATGTAGSTLVSVAASALAKLPALWVVVGLTTLLIGLFPRAGVGASWGVVGLMLVLELGWELGVVNAGVFDISPFAHVYPGTPISAWSLLGLTALAAALAVAGITGFGRRDLT